VEPEQENYIINLKQQGRSLYHLSKFVMKGTG